MMRPSLPVPSCLWTAATPSRRRTLINSSADEHRPQSAGAGEFRSAINDLLKSADDLAAQIGYPDASLMHEYHRHLLMLWAQAYVQVFATRIEAPDFVPHTGALFPWGVPNHDTVYGFAPLDSGGLYRVSGVKGTETIASLMFRRGGANTGEMHGATLGEIDMTKVNADAQGRFSLLLHNERPAGYSDEWHAIPRNTTSLVARHVTAEAWQKDGVWALERLDRTPAAAGYSPQETARGTATMISFVLRQTEFLMKIVKGLHDRGAVNEFVPEKWTGAGGIAAQMYYQTLFSIEEDEALILETTLPQSVTYWSAQLVDPLYRGIDFVFRQSALNGKQVHVDADGRIRLVLSLVDPGVQNWLDPAGWRRGGIMWRWMANSHPMPTTKRVKLAELRRNLPDDTPRMNSAERSASLSARAVQYQSRRRW